MLDLRADGNERLNAPVPRDMALAYMRYVDEVYTADFPDGIPTTFPTPLSERDLRNINLLNYRASLIHMRVSQGPIELRAMLSLTGDAYASEFAAGLLAGFMLGLGYDGLIYNEGGDVQGHPPSASHVFFTLEHLGDYNAWHALPTSDVPSPVEPA